MLIQHARLVDAGGEREGDILIRDGRIAAVGEGLAAAGGEPVLDAAGLLTKPIGIGVLTTGAKAELTTPEAMELAYRLMTTLNKSARDAMIRYRVHACTDVTGFGLLGHAFEMAQGSDVRLDLEVDGVDLIPEALELARMGILPAGMYRNRHFAEAGVDAGDVELARQDLLYDPQTAGSPVPPRPAR